MIWQQLRGHQQQIEMFRRAIQRNRLAHAYLLVGPSGIGKRLFANLLAQCLFCQQHADVDLDACGECHSCRQMQAGTHPDLLEVGLPEGKREIPIETMVGDREHRGRTGLCHDIAMTPMSATRRIAIVNDADAMNEASANSLLKTLEEPPSGSLIFLLTPDTEPVLPTIRSRCQPVRFSPLANDDLVSLLKSDAPDLDSIPEEIITMAEGSLDLATRLLDPGLKKLWKTVATSLTRQQLEPARAIKGITEALDELGGDTAAQRQNMRWVVRFSIESLRQRLESATTVDECDRVGEMLDRCFEAELHLRQTMPIPLCLESLYMELGRRSRAGI